MNDRELARILEALVMSAQQPVTLVKLAEVFGEYPEIDVDRLKNCLLLLQEDYKASGIELKCLASGYIFQTKSIYSPWIARMQLEKPPKYSKAFLETLAIIAYKQPVTRADIEDIRGVSVNSQIMKSLLERGWVRVAGHRDVPGKPAVYVTTKSFLDYFNLNSLSDLPSPSELNSVFANHAEPAETECEI